MLQAAATRSLLILCNPCCAATVLRCKTLQETARLWKTLQQARCSCGAPVALQQCHAATHYNTPCNKVVVASYAIPVALQQYRTARHCKILQNTATRNLSSSCATLVALQQCHIATHCKDTTTHCNKKFVLILCNSSCTATMPRTQRRVTHCTTLQQTATHCTTLQHTLPLRYNNNGCVAMDIV